MADQLLELDAIGYLLEKSSEPEDRALLAAGADAKLKDKHGQTALNLAQYNYNGNLKNTKAYQELKDATDK